MATRKGWIYKDDGTIIEKGTGAVASRRADGTMFVPDLPEFKSPIDGKLYSGRAGLREHNLRHGVINNEELTGLPYETMNREYKPDRAAIREEIIRAARKNGVL
jgi:hypothetical protein